MTLSPFWVLAAVGAIMLALALRDVATQRRVTPAAKARLLVALIFGLVLAWLAWRQAL